MLGKAFPYPADAGFGLCPWFSPDGAGVWSQQGLQDGAALAVAAFRVYAPPAQVAAFRVLWGHFRGFSLWWPTPAGPSRAATGG